MHTFCERCIELCWNSGSTFCPNDSCTNKPTTGVIGAEPGYTHVERLQRVIDKLRISCCYREKGCPEFVAIAEIKTHEKETCQRGPPGESPSYVWLDLYLTIAFPYCSPV